MFKIWHKYKQIVTKPPSKETPTHKINIIQNVLIPRVNPMTSTMDTTNVTIEIIGDLTQEEIAEGLTVVGNDNFTGVLENQEIINLDENKEKKNILNFSEPGDIIFTTENNDTETIKFDGISSTVEHNSLPVSEKNMKLNTVQEIKESKQPKSPFKDTSNVLKEVNSKIRTKPLSLNEVWDKHLHYPTIEKSAKRIKEKVPLAIVSKKWKEYHQLKNKQKQEKEKIKEKRKAERDLKKIQSRKENTNKSSRRHVRKKRSNENKRTNESNNTKQNKCRENRKLQKESNYNETSEEDSDEYTLGEIRDKMQTMEKQEKYNYDLTSSDSADSCQWEIEKEIPVLVENNKGISVADFVIVEYERQYYPGVVVKTSLNECEVRVMTKTETELWKWPKQVDQIWYKNEDILDKIEAPILSSENGNYIVPEIKKYCT